MKANIPSDWNGESWTSKCVQWPDSPSWLSILAGLINMVSRGRNWTDDSGDIRAAIEIGDEIWSRFQAAEECTTVFDVRQLTTDPCHLEKSSGGAWEVWADLSLCGAQMFQDPPYDGPGFTIGEDDCLNATVIAWEFYSMLLALNTQRASASSEQDMFFRTLTTLSTHIAFPNVNQLLALSSTLWAGSNAGFAESFITSLREDMTCNLLTDLPAMNGEAEFTIFQEARDSLASFFAGYAFAGSIAGLAKQVCLYLVQAMHTADFMLLYYDSEIDTGDCGTCSEGWCYEWDFTSDDFDWLCDNVPTLDRGYGSYSVNVGFVGEQIGDVGQPGSGAFIWAHLAFGESVNVTHIEFDWELSSPPNESQKYLAVRREDGSNLPVLLQGGHDAYQGTGTYEWSGDEDISGIWLQMAVGWRPQSIKITRCQLRGTGTNPFGEDNCT